MGFLDSYHAHVWAKTYLHDSFVDQVLADDSGSSQAGVSRLGGCRVHWLHEMRSKEKGERILRAFCNGNAEKLPTSKMAAGQRDEGGERGLAVHISALTHAKVPVEMKAVSSRRTNASQQHTLLEPGVLTFSQAPCPRSQCQENVKGSVLFFGGNYRLGLYCGSSCEAFCSPAVKKEFGTSMPASHPAVKL